jgi:chaperonin GroEL
LRQIALNAGAEASVIADRVRGGREDFGYNARTGGFASLMADGVIDPAKVVVTALRNAASIAGLLLTTDCLIAEKKAEAESAGKAYPEESL